MHILCRGVLGHEKKQKVRVRAKRTRAGIYYCYYDYFGHFSPYTAGFIRLMSREYRQSLDQQLSTQALYAAESGINDARKSIADAVANGTINDLVKNEPDKDCNNDDNHKVIINNAKPDNNLFNQGTFLSYSCLLVDNGVENIQVDNASENSGRLYPIETQSSTGPLRLKSIPLQW